MKIEGTVYVPVKDASTGYNTNNAIIPKFYGKINTLKIGEQNYIPLSIIPVVYRPAFNCEYTSPVS